MAGPLPSGEPLPDDGALPSEALAEATGSPLSVYLHVPFCATRCGYCDFNTYTPSELGGDLTTSWLQAVHAEIDLATTVLKAMQPQVGTVFVGGGTPTLLSVDALSGLLAHLRRAWPWQDDAEVTTEANPESVTPESLAGLREAGFTRMSFGMQSATPHVLQFLERRHTPDRAVAAAGWAADAGFDHISLDLIHGTPGETLAEWEETLRTALAAPVDHISSYALIVEDGTRLGRRVRTGKVPAPDDDDQADKYLLAEELLSAAGFANYEISNWARPGGQCCHNLAYWRSAPWWGIGPGAHSHVGGVRWWNVKHPHTYIQRLAGMRSPGHSREVLSAEDRRTERVLLELRLSEGLPVDVLRPTELARLRAEGDLVWERQGRVGLTAAGRLLADGVVRRTLD